MQAGKGFINEAPFGVFGLGPQGSGCGRRVFAGYGGAGGLR